MGIGRTGERVARDGRDSDMIHSRIMSLGGVCNGESRAQPSFK